MIHRIEKRLGKLLFPRSERWRQQQKARVVLAISVAQIAAIRMILYVCHRGGMGTGGNEKTQRSPAGIPSLFQ